MSDIGNIKKFFDKEEQNILNDLDKLISYKSRSTDRKECEEALEFVLNRASEMGFETQMGKYKDVGTVVLGDGEETIGILAHVDVVPEGVPENWNSDPFKLTLSDGELLGRGVVDDKGPVIACLYALKYLKERKISLNKRIMLIIGTMEEIKWEDMDHFKEEFELPDYGFSPDGTFPIFNRENGYIDVELIFKELELIGDENIKGGSARNSIPSSAEAFIGGDKLEYKGINAHSSVPSVGKNAIALMCEDLAAKTNLRFAEFMAKYFPEDVYSSNLKFRMKDGSMSGDGDLTIVPTLIRQAGNKIYVNLNVRNDYKLPTKSVIEALEEKREEGNYDISIIEILESVWVDEDLPWVRRMDKVLTDNGLPGGCRFAPGCTYAKSIPNIVCFGPVFEGDRECAHMDNEGQSLEHYILSAELYTQYLVDEMNVK